MSFRKQIRRKKKETNTAYLERVSREILPLALRKMETLRRRAARDKHAALDDLIEKVRAAVALSLTAGHEAVYQAFSGHRGFRKPLVDAMSLFTAGHNQAGRHGYETLRNVEKAFWEHYAIHNALVAGAVGGISIDRLDWSSIRNLNRGSDATKAAIAKLRQLASQMEKELSEAEQANESPASFYNDFLCS